MNPKEQPVKENKVKKAIAGEISELIEQRNSLYGEIKNAPEVNNLFRSFYAICQRKGEDTNWEAITNKIKAVLNFQPAASGGEDKQDELWYAVKDIFFNHLEYNNTPEDAVKELKSKYIIQKRKP